MIGYKTIVLTGASSGMGKLIAATLAKQGHRVFAAMRDISGRNAGNAADLRAIEAPHPIVPVDIDVTDDESVTGGIATVLGQTAEIDVLINCAGIMWTGTSEAFSVGQFRQMLETNLIGPFRMCKAVLPTMRDRKAGLIITVSSTCGRTIPPNFSLYSASKFGLEAMAEGLGYEVSGLGIDTVIIEPGPFATNLMANQQEPAGQDIVEAYGEYGRLDKILGERMWPMLQASGISVDPQQVADLVSDLIAMKPGTRPIRTTVGMDSGVAEMNKAIEAGQMAFLKALEFDTLARVTT